MRSAKSSRVSPEPSRSSSVPAYGPRDTPISYGDLQLDDVEQGEGHYPNEKHHPTVFVVQNSGSLMLDMDEYRQWLEDLGSGDLQKIETTLKNADPFERNKLLCGRFIFQNKDVMYTTFTSLLTKEILAKYAALQKKRATKDGKRFLVCATPIGTAIQSNRMDVMKRLVTWGADILAGGICDWNPVHLLVVMSVVQPQSDAVVKQYKVLRQFILDQPNLGLPVLRQLLMAEDVGGLRPIELASRIGALDMANEILDTEDVYRFTKACTGYQNIAHYDITDYTTNGKRVNLRPFLLLSTLTYERLSQLGQSRSFHTSALMKWVDEEIRTRRWLLRMWMLYRLVYVVAFMVLFQDLLVVNFHCMRRTEMFDQFMGSQNVTNVTAKEDSMNSKDFNFDCPLKSFTYLDGKTLYYILVPLIFARLVTTIIAHAFDMKIFFRHPQLATRILADEKTHRTVGSCSFYINCDLLHIISATVVIMIANHSDLQNTTTRGLLFTFIAIASICNVWSCLYFVRLSSRFGHFVVTFQEMMGSMVNFMLIQFLILLSFSVTFFAILGSQCLHTDFDTFWSSIYATFITMLNMVSFTDQVTISRPEGLVVILLHTIYVLVVAVLLLNFLIALMSNTVTQVGEHKAIVNKFHRLYVSMTVAHRFGVILKRVARLDKGNYVREKNKVYFVATYVRTECAGNT